MLRKNCILAGLALSLSVFCLLPESASAETVQPNSGASFSYSGNLGQAAAAYSISPQVKVVGDNVVYGAAFNSFGSVDLNSLRAASISGSASSTGFVAADGSHASGSRSASFESNNANGGSSSKSSQSSFSSGGSLAQTSYSSQRSGSRSSASGNTLSWSVSVSKDAGGSREVQKSVALAHSVTF